MKILAVDIGTGTQDILLYDSSHDLENSFKLVLPSPTMMVRERIRQATRRRTDILIHGLQMGGGPCSWAVEDHLRAGLAVYATPNAALTLNDDLSAVADLGVHLVSEDEALQLRAEVVRIEMQDFDFPAILRVFTDFGVSLDELAAVAVAVFDHGAAPPDVSDRQFRFDYLDARIRAENRLSAFAYLSDQVPPILSRLQAVAQSAPGLPAPLVVMDTAPAAVSGARLDSAVASLERCLIVNVGNFHTLAFLIGPAGIEGLFEHHTGLLDQLRLEGLCASLAGGTLTHAEVFGSNGHGALVYDPRPFSLSAAGIRLVVTGPRRAMLKTSSLRPYFAAPYGDMMIAGCFGLLSAAADLLPDLHDPIIASLYKGAGSGIPPWED